MNSWSVRAYDLMPARYYQPAYRYIAGSLELTSGAILDVGCGPGWVAIHASVGNPELDCVGIDLSPDMVRLAERNRGNRLNCTFKVMDAAEIIYPDATFDRIVAVQTMHHWSDPDAILRELHRVLKPAGQLVLLDADADGDVPSGWIARRGPWPPDVFIKRMWEQHSLGADGLRAMTERVSALDWTVKTDKLGFYRRLVATKA
ncbi:MAG: class I SAM-dependent methyltransferase [Proteobacteria bacterium]|nr:class I SAM-dependent methyltransferase [Pseudomonadota bacterium]MCP4917036.1 class I SAM-dependent methyltransferase [Pseudomonadota bacterium]